MFCSHNFCNFAAAITKMKEIMRRILIMTTAALLMAGCGGNSEQQEAEALLSRGTTLYEQGSYTEALATIDSLRRTYPNVVDTRKKALKLRQDIELKKTQEELALTDSLLQIANQDYAQQQAKVDKDKAQLKATPEELTLLTRNRMRRDSLRTQFEVLGAKIRYIHQKQKELEK